MKSRVTNFLVTLMVAGGLSINYDPPSQGQGGLPNKRIEISKYGTLIALRGADGKILLGDSKRPLGEGYALGYKFTNPQTGKLEEGFVYAVGDEHSNNLEAAETENNAAAGDSVKTTVKTKDGALALTHEFTLDDKNGELKVRRRIQSNSSKGVQLIVVKSHASSWLVGIERPTPLQSLFDYKDLVRGVAGAGIHRIDSVCICPLPPPCPTEPWCRLTDGEIRAPLFIIKAEKNPRPEFKLSGVGKSDSPKLLRSGTYGATLYWKEGKNMKNAQIQKDQTLTFDVIHKTLNR